MPSTHYFQEVTAISLHFYDVPKDTASKIIQQCNIWKVKSWLPELAFLIITISVKESIIYCLIQGYHTFSAKLTMSLWDNSNLIRRPHIGSFEKLINMHSFNTSKSYSPFLSPAKFLGIFLEVIYCVSDVSYLKARISNLFIY